MMLDLIPRWFRTRWPLKRFYWQQEELDAAEREAKEFVKTLRWGE